MFITIDIFYSLKSGNLIPPALFFCLKIPLALEVLLCFHTNGELFCSSSVTNVIGSSIGMAMNCRLLCVA